ncbi:hypothetical protein ACFLXB_01260 [Chloroflexota bacterium]
MGTEKDDYYKLLSKEGGLKEQKTIKQSIEHMEKKGFDISPISLDLLKTGVYGKKITEQLTRLPLFLIKGNPSWEGLLVGFPGTVEQLSTKSLTTPYIRMILYPILDLHHRMQSQYEFEKRFPCIHFVGQRFSDVFLRKIELLNEVIPHIIVITHDIFACSLNKKLPLTEAGPRNESWTQMKLSQQMDSDEGLQIPIALNKTINIKYLAYEIPCNEGTEDPERLDILGYDKSDRRLIAFELKGPRADRVALENLFLQGMEHRNWIEKNKMAVKLLFDDRLGRRKINSRKRVRLILGFYEKKVPTLFYELREEAKRRDPYTEIYFVRLENDGAEVVVRQFQT